MSETKTKNLCTVPAADLTDSQYFIAEDGGELKRIPKAQVVLKKLEKMLATDTENLAGGGEVTAQELLDVLAEQVANKLLAKSQVVNNLLATVEGNPLDATQGKALKELIDTTNNNLSKRFAYATSGCVYNTTSDFPTSGSGFGVNTQALTLYAGFVIPEYSRICFMNYGNSNDGALTAVSPSGDIYSAFRNVGIWHNGKICASKDDLGKFLTASGSAQAKEGSYIIVTSIKLPAGHTYLVIGSNQVSENLTSIISSQLVGFNSAAETYSFYLGDSRSTGLSGGGCLCAAIVSTKAECTISLRGYGYSSGTYDYIGKLFAVQLA